MWKKIEAHYDVNPAYEWERLERHRMEYAVTLRALADYLPEPPAAILDVGGGPGRYSIELARQGYDVTLVDLARGNLDLAAQKAQEAGIELHAMIHANALDLALLPDAHYDAALLMGPLYHLHAEADRRQALTQTLRKLKPGGRLFAAFIGRYAVHRWLAWNDPAWVLREPERHERLLATGEDERPVEAPVGQGLADAYLAHPTEIVPFMESCGLETLALIGCEGISDSLDSLLNQAQPEVWNAWVDLNYQPSQDPSLHGACSHLLYVGQKSAE